MIVGCLELEELGGVVDEGEDDDADDVTPSLTHVPLHSTYLSDKENKKTFMYIQSRYIFVRHIELVRKQILRAKNKKKLEKEDFLSILMCFSRFLINFDDVFPKRCHVLSSLSADICCSIGKTKHLQAS